MANSGVYFITCVFLGRRFVKIGRSANIKRRRSQLQSGCPFRLEIEHVQPMSEAEAMVQEREWHSLFKNIRKQSEWFNAKCSDAQAQLMFRWFPYDNDIEAFVERLKEENPTSVSGKEEDGQRRLFS